ncbi:MAG: NADH:ubiquinone oxidoreductase [Alistipes sp.]|jgi:Ni,Fe-hydrogenase III small subunit/ferredoxin|nr:NADH:ubiquinone oxidoreductase [Alistipes sp.]
MIFPKIKVLKSHGWQYIPNLNDVTLTEEFRGRPELTETDNMADVEAAAKICPTGAISTAPFSLDLGRCMFCGECALCAPKNIRFTNDYKIGSTSREALIVKPGAERVEFHHENVRKEIPELFGKALKLRQVSAGGDASVEMELNATGNVNFDFGRYGVEFVASPRHADGVVITGPISSNMAEALDICYNSIPDPKIVIVCGSEACSGGLYADSRAVDRRFMERYNVDLWLPGAPTHPMTFIDGVMNMLNLKRR